MKIQSFTFCVVSIVSLFIIDIASAENKWWKNGDWVLTDIANSHHKDFQKTDWETVAACDEFVVKRLKNYK